MTDFRFDAKQLRNSKLNRRKATLRTLIRLGFSPADIARIDGDCTAWDIIEYQRFVAEARAKFRDISDGKI